MRSKRCSPGKPVPVEITKPHGCSTKWTSKQDRRSPKQMEKWDKTPVDVEPIDAAGVAALRKGGTKNVRLFNVWATWCGPCVAEFPELVTTARKFDMRNFEFISISIDEPKDCAEGESVSRKARRRPFRSPAKIRESRRPHDQQLRLHRHEHGRLDESARSRVARRHSAHRARRHRTANILWRHNGAVNGDELRAKVLEHLGNYYKPE